jgi:outer membrane protein OmpA-like peptidoglycan-associated protein
LAHELTHVVQQRGTTAQGKLAVGDPQDQYERQAARVARTRAFFEPRLGLDLRPVRIHTGGDAAMSTRPVNARAYTLGSSIVFASGEYQPASDSARHLIAHELAHVAQQPSSSAFRRSTATPVPLTPVNGETLHREVGDALDDVFESSSNAASEQPGEPGTEKKKAACPKVPTKLGDEVPVPSCPTATHIGTNEVARFSFCLDSDEPISLEDLGQLATIVSGNHPKTRFLIHGYASPEGRVKYNFNLACHRANRIAEEMHEPIRAQVRTRLPAADQERINTETGAEIQGRLETAAQGPTSAFGSPEANRLVIVYAQAPGGSPDEEPSCEDARRGIGKINPETPLDLPTMDLTGMDGGPHLNHFHFCLDSDVLAATTPKDIRGFARAQASKAKFVVHGFSSEEGDAEYNRRLSAHRALRIARELTNAGVRSEQIGEVSALGETTKFGDKDFNRVAIVFAEGGEIDEFDTGTRDAKTKEQKDAAAEEARQRILAGQYNLAADAYISFWTCGRTRTVSEAVERLTIQTSDKDDDERLRGDANGTEEGTRVNTVRLSNVALRAENAIECTMGRLIDMSFHHAELGNPDLPTNFASRHRAGLHLIHLAGLGACEGKFAVPDVKRGAIGIDAPLESDPRARRAAPACAEAPEPTRLHFPTEGAKGRERPDFNFVGKPEYIPARGKLNTNFKPGEKGNPAILFTTSGTDILTAKAEIQFSGDPATFSDYEVGFIQSIIADETQADYDSGHSVIQGLPVPIRHAALRSEVPVPAPWTTLDSMATPSADGNVKLSTSGIKLHSETAISLGALDRTLPANSILSTFEEGTRIAIWLIARRRGAPLDRFSIHFIDGVMYDVTQVGHLEHRHAKGAMFGPGPGGTLQTVDPSLRGEGEIPAYVGGFLTGKASELPADPSQMRLHGAVSSEVRLTNQVKKIVEPSAPGLTAMGKAELTAVVTDILDNLEVFADAEDAATKTGGKRTPRLGFDFIPLKITLPFVRSTGRLQLAEGDNIVTTLEGPGLGSFAAFHLAKALEFRIHHRGSPGADVIVRPSILSGSGEIGTVVLNIPARPRDKNAPAEEESDLIKRPDVLELMSEAWACTLLTKTPQFVMVGAREFAQAFSMDRDKKIAADPPDRLQAGEEEIGGEFTTPMPCPARPDNVVLGSFHTHPEVVDNPVATEQDMKYVRGCGGAQHFIITDNKVFRIQRDGSTTLVPVTLKVKRPEECHQINIDDIIKVVKKKDENEF